VTLDWTPAERPARAELRGRSVLLRPVSADDADTLFEVSRDPAIWTYLHDGPYETAADLREALGRAERSEDPLFFTLVTLPDEAPAGIASYMRMTPEHGVVEIGHIWFGSTLQRTTAATEAIFLLARHAFDELGYRRLEWKCNALNDRSRAAAERFGFTFEGIFRNHMVVKGKSRDTAWYAITDEEWPAIRVVFERWLDPGNFDSDGRQKRPMSFFRDGGL
jgi:RimJ/RimL family protein N-acetyltransferase